MPAEQGLLGGLHLWQPEIEPGGRQLEAQRQGIDRQGLRPEDQAREPSVGRRVEPLCEAFGLEILAWVLSHHIKGCRLTRQLTRPGWVRQ